ncbi:glycosyltransferase family 4 protein [Acidobacteria bacterium AH-259-L09]|nr:glycosyltransferase family 4 protein [Acidobacteria bacterium AH-259-L09]
MGENLVHIGIDARELQEHMTGIGRFLEGILPYLQCWKPHWKWTLFYTSERGVARHSDCERVKLRSRSILVQDQWEIPRLAKKMRIDLFFSPYYKLPCFLPCPGIVVVHDVNILFSPEYDSLTGRAYRCYFFVNLQISVSLAAVAFVVSNWTRHEVLRRFWVRPEKIKVNYTGLKQPSVKETHPEWERFRREQKIEDNYFLYVGNLKPHKNLLFLIDVYEQLPSKLRREYKLVIAGNHSRYRRVLQEKVKEKKLTDRVRLLGHVPNELLNDLYRAGHLFVFPSLFEGFGLPPLEAMAQGLPVVSSNATSLEEVVGKGGWTLDPGDRQQFIDAIVALCEDSVRYEEFRQRGKSWVRQFSSQKTARIIIQEMEKLLH